MQNLCEFHEQLKAVCDFLIENKTKTDYVLNQYYQRDNIEFEDLSCLETNCSQSQKLEMRLLAKKKEIDLIKSYLPNFRNEKFKSKIADFIQWLNLQMDPPKSFKYPTDLKSCISKLKRYDSDLQMICEDVNDKFKSINNARK